MLFFLSGGSSTAFGASGSGAMTGLAGRVGRVERSVVAVVRYDDQLGKLMYWKEQ